MHRSSIIPALVVLALAASASAQDVPALEAKAKELFKAKAYMRPAGENVVDVCKEIIKVDPTNATAADLLSKVEDVLVGGGEGKLKKRDYKGALANFEQALTLDSGNARAKAGRDKARDGLSRDKFEVEPGMSPEAYMAKGNDLFSQEDYVRARKYYLAILKTIPDDPFALKREKECADKLGIGSTTGSSTPTDPAAKIAYYREVAAQLEKSGEWEAALSYRKQVLAAMPDDPASIAAMQRAEDNAGGYARVKISMAGDPFFWSAKADTPEEAKAELAITVKVIVDGKESATYRDDEIETLAPGDVCKNQLKLPEGFSARVANPASNVIAFQILVGTDKPRNFAGQGTVSTQKGVATEVTIVGSSTLKFGGGFSKKMGGAYTIAVKPAAAAP
ncbi:MAG: hypothetical protein U0166_13090 [Acidobacteriota bacterium]